MDKARFPGFYKLSIGERLKKVHDNGWISNEDLISLRDGHHLLPLNRADKMIENVIGIMGLPMGLALNFQVNQKDYLVPLVVEEPSITAGLSAAAAVYSRPPRGHRYRHEFGQDSAGRRFRRSHRTDFRTRHSDAAGRGIR